MYFQLMPTIPTNETILTCYKCTYWQCANNEENHKEAISIKSGQILCCYFT